jgi:hypothetical protein
VNELMKTNGATTSTAGKMEHVNATTTPKAQYSMMVVNGSSHDRKKQQQ